MSRFLLLIVVQILVRSYLVYTLHQPVSDFHIWNRRYKAGDRLKMTEPLAEDVKRSQAKYKPRHFRDWANRSDNFEQTGD